MGRGRRDRFDLAACRGSLRERTGVSDSGACPLYLRAGCHQRDVVADGYETTVEPGDAIVVPATAPDLRNDGASPAVALGIALFAPVGEGMARALAARNGGAAAARVLALELAMIQQAGTMAALEPGVTVAPVASASVVALPAGPVRVGLGRAVLPTGTGLPGHRVPGVELLAVEEGTLRLDVVAGPAPARPPDSAADESSADPPHTVESGRSVAIQAASIGAAEGAGDTELALLIAVVGPAPAAPSSP
jgi:quercetin dioxygenase-like cupin family protein